MQKGENQNENKALELSIVKDYDKDAKRKLTAD